MSHIFLWPPTPEKKNKIDLFFGFTGMGGYGGCAVCFANEGVNSVDDRLPKKLIYFFYFWGI
jgi:hypothetical protein